MAAFQKDFEAVNCSLPEHHIFLKKMKLQAMDKPNSSCCVLSRSPGTSKHRAMQTQSFRDVLSYFILHEWNPHNQK